jgi:hypothetical protein
MQKEKITTMERSRLQKELANLLQKSFIEWAPVSPKVFPHLIENKI